MSALPSTYKALVYEKYGPIDDVLQFKHVPMEPIKPTSVRIRVHCAALNPADSLVVEGVVLRPLPTSPSADAPHRLGFDASGVIVEVGSQVGAKFNVGDEVYTMTPFETMNTLAEYAEVDADSVALKPKSLDFSAAAAAPTVSLTSYQAMTAFGKLQPGERMLILGGSTAVGMFAIQYAKMIGAYVMATASTKKVDFLKSLGADEVIDYTTTKWIDVIPAHSLDVVFDCGVEPEAWDGDAQIVLKKEGSRFVGALPSATSSPPKYGATYVPVYCYESSGDLAAIAKLIDDNKIKPIVDTVFRFEETLEGMKLVKSRRVLGKVVIQIQ